MIRKRFWQDEGNSALANREAFAVTVGLASLMLLVSLAGKRGCSALEVLHDSEETHLRVNLNTASADEIAMLPVLGPSLAGRIISYRDSIGEFQSEEDLLSVSGIGPKTLAKLKFHIGVSPAGMVKPTAED